MLKLDPKKAILMHFALVLVLMVYLVVHVLTNNTVTPKEARDRIEAMTYGRDSRTGLCFAVFYWHDETQSVTNVPCTLEVLSQIKP